MPLLIQFLTAAFEMRDDCLIEDFSFKREKSIGYDFQTNQTTKTRFLFNWTANTLLPS